MIAVPGGRTPSEKEMAVIVQHLLDFMYTTASYFVENSSRVLKEGEFVERYKEIIERIKESEGDIVAFSQGVSELSDLVGDIGDEFKKMHTKMSETPENDVLFNSVIQSSSTASRATILIRAMVAKGRKYEDVAEGYTAISAEYQEQIENYREQYQASSSLGSLVASVYSLADQIWELSEDLFANQFETNGAPPQSKA